MACALPELKLCMRRGSTVRIPISVETDELVWKPITAIALTAPIELGVPLHGCPDKWRAAVTGVRQPREVNAAVPLKDSAFLPVDVVDANTVSFNRIDGSVLRPYTSGGHLVYYKPLDFSLYTGARMSVKDKIGGTLLAHFTTEGLTPTLELDNVSRRLWISEAATVTALKGYKKGVFDIELYNGGGEVRALCSAESTLIILPEITTDVTP
jgi:hypothetical protein